MTNRVLTTAPEADLSNGEASTEDPFRRVADIIETRGRSDIWSEPDVKIADADETFVGPAAVGGCNTSAKASLSTGAVGSGLQKSCSLGSS